MKAQTLRLQKKVATQDVAVRFRHAHRCANRGLCSAKQIYPRGSVDLAVPYLCRKAQASRCQQKVATQDVAARFKLIAQAWYTCDIALHAFLRNVPVCFPEYCRVLELAACFSIYWLRKANWRKRPLMTVSIAKIFIPECSGDRKQNIGPRCHDEKKRAWENTRNKMHKVYIIKQNN